MEFRTGKDRGIRGWSVTQGLGTRGNRRAGSSFRDALGARGGLVTRIVVVGLAGWAASALLLGDKGVLRLRAMHQQESALQQDNADLRQQLKETKFELNEAPGLTMERVMRERYRKSLPNERVFQKVAVAPDSTAGSLENESEMGR